MCAFFSSSHASAFQAQKKPPKCCFRVALGDNNISGSRAAGTRRRCEAHLVCTASGRRPTMHSDARVQNSFIYPLEPQTSKITYILAMKNIMLTSKNYMARYSRSTARTRRHAPAPRCAASRDSWKICTRRTKNYY